MTNDNVVKSAARVLEVFEFFAARRAAASVSDVCAALGYPQSSTSVLLKSLLTLGYLAYDTTTRRYIPTHRVAILGNWLPDSASELPEVLRGLHEETRGIAFVGQLNGSEVQWLQAAQGVDSDRAGDAGTAREPVARSAAGHVLLSTLTDGQVLRIVRRANARDAQRVDERTLLDSIADARRAGYAISEDVSAGTGQMALLAGETSGATPLAIGLVVPLERLRSERAALLSALQGATNGVDVLPAGGRGEFPRSGATPFGSGLMAGNVRQS